MSVLAKLTAGKIANPIIETFLLDCAATIAKTKQQG